MTRQIRKGAHKTGLILANGGVLTYQHALCLSSAPRRAQPAYPLGDPQPQIANGAESPPFDDVASGDATIEVRLNPDYPPPARRNFRRSDSVTRQTYTVEFDRRGQPGKALIIGVLDKTGRRFLANHGDEATLRKLCDTNLEPVGLRGVVKTLEDGRNEFVLRLGGKL